MIMPEARSVYDPQSGVCRGVLSLRLAHSPDPDDAFMWWPLFAINGHPPRVASERFRFEPVMCDIESLNKRAMAASQSNRAVANLAAADQPLEITAISCAAYPLMKNLYAITACGSSMGDAYGPKIVARLDSAVHAVEALRCEDVVIAVPGERTSAFAAMTMLLGRSAFRYEVTPFKQITGDVASGRFAAGLIIHEGQLNFAEKGLKQIIDLGAWWKQRHGLPLPLGVNVVRRDLEGMFGTGTLREIAALLRRSVEYALAHREESIAYAMQFAGGMTAELADEFIRLYVNRWTLDFGDEGRQAVRTFLRETHKAGLTPQAGSIDFIG